MTKDRRNAAAAHNGRTTRRGILIACAAAMGTLFSAAVPAQRGDLVARPRVTLQQAVEIATARRPGRVVRAVTVDSGRIHEVRILLEEGGRVVTVRVDSQTGRVR